MALSPGDAAFFTDWESQFDPVWTVKLTDADIPHIKGMLKCGGGIYVSRTMAKAMKKKGFEEGTHYHVQKPLPTGTRNGERKLRRAR